MVRVLQISGNMNMGGQETFIMNVYRNIDRSKVQFDFVVHSKERGYYDDEIEKLGGRIYRITPMTRNIFKHCKELKSVIKNGKYEIVHRHTSSSIVFIDLLIAKICGVKKRIAHSHSNKAQKSPVLNMVCRLFLNALATEKLACSLDAKNSLYGNIHNYKILYNAIEIDKFLFNETMREKIRKKNKCQNKFVIGHIGRFSPEKNHKFILELYNEILKDKSNVELWLIGDGQLKKNIIDRAKQMNLIDKIKFLGIVDNVCELLQGMDIFIFPSLYEGLGISLIEAQVSGLDCIASTNIQNEAIITNKVVCKDLDINEWKKEICRKRNNERIIDKENEGIKKFSIENLKNEMTKIYLS